MQEFGNYYIDDIPPLILFGRDDTTVIESGGHKRLYLEKRRVLSAAGTHSYHVIPTKIRAFSDCSGGIS